MNSMAKKKTERSSFDYVSFDEQANLFQSGVKDTVQILERTIIALGGKSKTARRYRRYAIKALEETYMWIGKGIRENQIERDSSTTLEKGRVAK